MHIAERSRAGRVGTLGNHDGLRLPRSGWQTTGGAVTGHALDCKRRHYRLLDPAIVPSDPSPTRLRISSKDQMSATLEPLPGAPFRFRSCSRRFRKREDRECLSPDFLAPQVRPVARVRIEQLLSHAVCEGALQIKQTRITVQQLNTGPRERSSQ